MELFKLLGTIAITNSEANAAIDETTDKAEESESRVSSAFQKIGTAIATYFTVQKVIEFGQACISMASDVEEMENKFNVVFGDLSEDVDAWAVDFAGAIGRNSNTIKTYLADNQNMLVGMGATREEGAKLSEALISLALDLASFNNLSEPDAVNALSKAMMGETESAKTLGAVLNENTRAMAMEALAYDGKFDDLTELQKMEVNYQAILMQSTDAIGDCERSMGSYKSTTIELNSAKEKLHETIGGLLLPVMTNFVAVQTEAVRMVQSAVEWFMEHETAAQLLAIGIGTITTAIIAYNIAQNAAAIATTIATTATAAFGAVMAFATAPITLIILAIGALVAAGVLLYQNWETVSAKATEIFQLIADWISQKIEEIKAFFAGLWENLQLIWQNICNAIQVAVMFIAELFSAALQLWLMPWMFIWQNFGDQLTAAWNSFKELISNFLNMIATAIQNAWNAITAFLTPILQNISNFMSTTWNTILNTISSIMNAVSGVISSIWGSITATTSAIWNGIQNTINSIINSIRNAISNGLNAVFSTVSSIFNNIQNTISNIMNGAANVVSNAINRIKGFFNFSWSLPHLAMPHPYISGSFSLSPPSVPHFGISWYAKAMDEPMMFTKPTLFDVNPVTGTAKGAGEAGDEVMIGKETMLNMIRTAVAQQNSALADRLDDLIEMLQKFFPMLLDAMNRAIVLDSGALVAELAPAMDAELGALYDKKGRE